MAKRRLTELLRSLSAWVGSPPAEVGSEHPPEASTEGSLHLVERPVDRSLLWLPGGWGEQASSRPYPYELFVEQQVLRDVETHAMEEIEGSCGLLTGQLLACRETRVPFVSVEASHRSESPMPVGEDLTSFREFFWKVGEVAGRRGRIVVGWYHTHSLLGLQLSERDRQIHVAHFEDEWPCALVVVTRKGALDGGFFQRNRGDILFRRSTRPFRELVNQKVKPGGGPYVTAVRWASYWSHEPVLYIRKPGDLPSKGDRWSLRQRPRVASGSHKVADLADRISERPEDRDYSADLSGADVHEPKGTAPIGRAEGGDSVESRYETAIGRPVRDESQFDQSGHPLPASSQPEQVWDEWRKAWQARREQEDETQKVKSEHAASYAAEADADARAKAALAARAAAEAAARAAAEALQIGSEDDAIAAETVPKDEKDVEMLGEEEQVAQLAAAGKTDRKAARVANGRKAKEPEVEEPICEETSAAEIGGETAATEIAEAMTAADVESEAASEAEPEREQAEAAELEVPGPAMEEEILVSEVAANESVLDRVAGDAPPAAESWVRESSKEPATSEGVAARSSLQLSDDDEMVMPPLVLPDPAPRSKLQRHASWIGIGLAVAALVSWLILGWSS
jgi:proteasome lid subunit RPN8/RPN11